MKNKKFKSVLAGLLAAVLFISFMPQAAFAQQNAKATKEEVVYAKLNSNGGVLGVYVVNGFNVKNSGTLTDYGNYSSVNNLSSTQNIDYDGNAVKVAVEEGSFYYQGNLQNAQLPWNIDIEYTLNGVKTEPESLGGTAGALEIKIAVNNANINEQSFFENYMLQITLTLNPEIFSNINSEKATFASAGKNKILNFTHLPNKNAEYIISADVADFEMASIEISALPYDVSFDMPDTSELTQQMVLLSDAVALLDDGVGELASGLDDFSGGLSQLANGTNSLKTGSAEFSTGMQTLASGAAGLVSGSAQINSGLAQMQQQLATSDFSALENLDLSALQTLPAALRQLSGALSNGSSGIADNLSALNSGFAAVFTALDDAVSAMNSSSLTTIELDVLYNLAGNSVAPENPALEKILSYYTAAQALIGTYASVKPAFEAVQNGLGPLATGITDIATALNTAAAGIESAMQSMGAIEDLEQITQLINAINSLANEYSKFHSGLSEYAGGVSSAAAGYAEIHKGISGIADGAAKSNEGSKKMLNGANELHKGTSELSDGLIDMPAEIEEQIEDLTADYSSKDFTPVSFVSSKNTTSYVQFVFMTEVIEKTKQEEQADEQAQESSVWNRFLNLFR